MTITREQVADLRPGDVVEITDRYLCTARGPLRSIGTKGLALGEFCVVRYSDGSPGHLDGALTDLTVISRAPRPLYVNHHREKPVPGDVVRDADSDTPDVWVYLDDSTSDDSWRGTDDWYLRNELPARFRLLVDGETGQVVP